MRVPAKLNLYLHITGKRPDGYHLLDSLIVFTDIYDEIEIEKADKFSMEISGEFEHLAPNNEQNIIVRTIALMKKECGSAQEFAVKLVKNIPVGAGLGGGSADAAATLMLLNEILNAGFCYEKLCEIGLKLGADVPVFIGRFAAYVSGIGEKLERAGDLPDMYAVLVYPNKMLATRDVFGACTTVTPAKEAIHTPEDRDCSTMDSRLRGNDRRNDLEIAAIKLLPEIKDIITELGKLADCEFARMSGSGSTCFAIFMDKKQAEENAVIIKNLYPNYWIKSCTVTASY